MNPYSEDSQHAQIENFTKFYDPKKKHYIDISWNKGVHLINNHADVEILTVSRKIKKCESSPKNVLFRTHQYDFTILMNENFKEVITSKYYVVEVKLFKQFRNEVNDFQEFTSNEGDPLIKTTYTNGSDMLCVSLSWEDQEKKKISYRGNFCFELSIYQKIDNHFYRLIVSKISSMFRIVSKPSVYLRKKKKKKKKTVHVNDENNDNENDIDLRLIPHLNNGRKKGMKIPNVNYDIVQEISEEPNSITGKRKRDIDLQNQFFDDQIIDSQSQSNQILDSQRTDINEPPRKRVKRSYDDDEDPAFSPIFGLSQELNQNENSRGK